MGSRGAAAAWEYTATAKYHYRIVHMSEPNHPNCARGGSRVNLGVICLHLYYYRTMHMEPVLPCPDQQLPFPTSVHLSTLKLGYFATIPHM